MIFNRNLILFSSVLNIVLCFRSEWESNQFNFLDINSTRSIIEEKDETIKVVKDFISKVMTEESIPGLLVVISLNETTQWIGAFGEIDIENSVKTNMDSIWRLAGISKTLTSVLMGQLIEKSLLDFNQPIDTYLPNGLFPKKVFNGKEVNITLKHLLSHTAGLRPTKIPDDFNSLDKVENVSQTLWRFKDKELIAEPGKKYHYSDNGYQLVGAIIESVGRTSFQNQLKEMCLKLGMNSTFAENPNKIYKLRPRYYQSMKNSTNKVVRAGLIDDLIAYNGFWPSNGIVSTVEDLLIFGKAIVGSFKGQNEKFLSPKVIQELWKPEPSNQSKPKYKAYSEYAKGWYIKEYNQSDTIPFSKLVFHPGILLGSSAILLLIPDEYIVGVVFANKGGAIGLDRIAIMMAKSSIEFVFNNYMFNRIGKTKFTKEELGEDYEPGVG